MSTEYIFFDESLCARFVQFAAAHQLGSQVRADAMQGSVVALAEDLSEALEDLVESEYEALMLEQMATLEADETDRSVLGVNVELASGQTCTVRIPSALGRRLFEIFSTEEIHDLVNAIVRSVESPSHGPLCQKA